MGFRHPLGFFRKHGRILVVDARELVRRDFGRSLVAAQVLYAGRGHGRPELLADLVVEGDVIDPRLHRLRLDGGHDGVDGPRVACGRTVGLDFADQFHRSVLGALLQIGVKRR